MIHTGIVQYLSEIDTNIFLYFNGIHSPFWDYFMSSFTGKFIWIPMYATILYILLLVSDKTIGLPKEAGYDISYQGLLPLFRFSTPLWKKT